MQPLLIASVGIVGQIVILAKIRHQVVVEIQPVSEFGRIRCIADKRLDIVFDGIPVLIVIED